MGLLSSALNRTAFLLDETGEALKERIKNLTPKKSTPYTALGILKAYGAFEWGICLSLKDGTYTSYTSIGLGIERTSIPVEKIWSPEVAGKTYVKLENGKILGIENAGDVSDYWLFPLVPSGANTSDSEPKEPWRGAMLLGASSPFFDPKPISSIVSDIIDKMYIQTEQIDPQPMSEESDNLEPGSIKEKITEYHSTHAGFGCIILENPESPEEGEEADFYSKASHVMEKTGLVIPLPKGRPLILLPALMDRELIAHRFSKSFHAVPVLSFETDNPDEAMSRINALL